MLNERYKKWFRALAHSEKLVAIKDKAIAVNKSYKKLMRASDAEYSYKGSRTGIRGGKKTTLSSNTSRASQEYNELIDELRYMAKDI